MTTVVLNANRSTRFDLVLEAFTDYINTWLFEVNTTAVDLDTDFTFVCQMWTNLIDGDFLLNLRPFITTSIDDDTLPTGVFRIQIPGDTIATLTVQTASWYLAIRSPTQGEVKLMHGNMQIVPSLSKSVSLTPTFMVLPFRSDLVIVQGSAFGKVWKWSVGDPPVGRDMHTFYAKMQVKDHIGGSVLLTFSSDSSQNPDGTIVLGSDGTITLSLSSLKTKAINWTHGVYDLKIWTTEGDDSTSTRFVQGSVDVNQEVTA